MIDRLMPLLLALALAPGAVQQACCCATGACLSEQAACPAEADAPPCCQAEAGHPPCCQFDDASESPLDPCRCPDCPSEASEETLATEPRVTTAEIDLSANLIGFASWAPVEAPPCRTAAPCPAPLRRPPPDRQALLCVWTI